VKEEELSPTGTALVEVKEEELSPELEHHLLRLALPLAQPLRGSQALPEACGKNTA